MWHVTHATCFYCCVDGRKRWQRLGFDELDRGDGERRCGIRVGSNGFGGRKRGRLHNEDEHAATPQVSLDAAGEAQRGVGEDREAVLVDLGPLPHGVLWAGCLVRTLPALGATAAT